MEINDRVYDLNVVQTAGLLGYHPQTVRDLARKGAIPGFKRRHAWYFCKEEIEELLAFQSKNYVDQRKLKNDLKTEFGDNTDTEASGPRASQ